MLKAIPRPLKELKGALLEAEARPVRYTKVDVLDYEPTDPHPEKQLALPGSITVLFARAGTPILTQIREAVSSRDGRDQRLAPRIYKQFRDRKMLSIAQAVDLLKKQPVFGDLRYGGMTLIANLMVPHDREVGLVALPYNGGSLANAGFTLVEHFREGEESAALDVVLLRHSAPLTKAEAAALRQVPSDQLELNVGHLGPDGACSVVILVAAVVVEAAVVAVTFAVTEERPRAKIRHLSDEEVAKLGPSASARSLLALRRAALEGRLK
jgi:hypothetical protein